MNGKQCPQDFLLLDVTFIHKGKFTIMYVNACMASYISVLIC